ncbi:MAG: BON domain-containing protein [Ostreibacterium sp.]
MQKLLIVSFISSTLILSGCTGLLFGGTVVGGTAVASVLHDRRTTGTVVDDRTLQGVIGREISSNPSLDNYSHISVTVFNKIVLLTGEAANQDTINRIIKTAKQTANIRKIIADIVVQPNSSLFNRAADATTTAKVKTALSTLEIPNFDATLVKVSTERSNVYLMGLVTPAEANAITDKTRRVRGVKSVIKVFEYIDPSQIKVNNNNTTP